MPASNSPVAVRSRAYRERRRSGVVVVPIEVSADAQKALVDAGIVTGDVPLDQAVIADGIWVLLSCLMDGALYFEAADDT